MTRARDVADTQDNVGGAVAPFVAGKNQIINGAMNVWQRGTSFSNSSGLYTADRWFTNGETTSTARSTDAPLGLAYSLQLTANTGFPLFQFIELPATGNGGIFTAGSVFTLSFYAKASIATTMQARMQFADDKNSTNSASIFALQNVANVTTSWARYTFTFTVANNANSTNILAELLLYKGSVASGTTMKITGVQLEQGSVATPFTTASGSIGGELALCQRYYQRIGAGDFAAIGISAGSAQSYFTVPLPVQMRTMVSVDYSNAKVYTGNAFGSVSAIGFVSADPAHPQLSVVGSGFNTWGYALSLSVTYLAFNGEL